MAINPQTLSLRANITGALIRDSRLKAQKTIDECAEAIGVSRTTFEEYELGITPISLPEVEGVSYFLGVPLEHFWGLEVHSSNDEVMQLTNLDQLIHIRQSMIGALLKQARLESGISLESLAAELKIDISSLEAYELGQAPIPLGELEVLASLLNRSIREFQDRHGPVGTWNNKQKNLEGFLNLSPEMQDFVGKPINRPYLELAMRLSEMSVDRLRSVAEGLLEITY